MERDELRTTLVNHLETLRRNLQVVSMEVLKTKYKKPFDALRQDICKAATAYTRFLVFDGMRIKHKYFDEAVPYIDAAVKQTKRLKQISDAAFQRQDIDEIESLALALRKEIEAALQPFYMGHIWLVILAGYSQPARFMRPYGIKTVNTAVLQLPASSVRSVAS